MNWGFHRSLRDCGIEVSILLSRQARDFTKVSGQLAKTDQVNARPLAAFGAVFFAKLQTTKPGSAFVEHLAGLLAACDQLVDFIAASCHCADDLNNLLANTELKATAAEKESPLRAAAMR